MNQGQAQADGDRCETRRCALVGGTENHDQEEGGHHHFGDHCGLHREAARGIFAVAVRGEAACTGEISLTLSNQIQHAACGGGAEHL